MNQVVAQKTEGTGLSYKNIGIAQAGGGGMLLPQTFGEVVAFATMMARSQHAIPKHLRENEGACMAVAMQALRWEMDPFAVAAKSYNVKDLIAYEAQLVAAVVNTRAPIAKRPVYRYEGTGVTRKCIVSCEMLDGSTKEYESPEIGQITTKNSPLWKADPDQQLGYFSIRSWARRHTPEVILGVYTPEEADQFRGPDNARDVTPSVMDRLKAQNATQEPQGEREGFSRAFIADQTDEPHDALTGEILDNQNTDATDQSPSGHVSVDDESSPDSSQQDGGVASPSASSPSSSSDDDMRGQLISFARATVTTLKDAALDPDAKRRVIEGSEMDWRDATRESVWPKMATVKLSAFAVIDGKRSVDQMAKYLAGDLLECPVSEIGG